MGKVHPRSKPSRGELVVQDLNDEPASVLLERIRQQRETAASNKQVQPKARRTRRNQKAKT